MSAYRIVEHTIPCSHIRGWPKTLANRQEDVLQLCVKQYIPIDNPNPQPGDVTILAAHACGFPKELYEPLWEDLAEKAKNAGWKIRSIWISDVAQQGASSVLNEQLLGDEIDWFDHSRDLMNLVNIKREDMPRPLVGIGHSMGGAQLTNLALMHPRLFTTLVLIDPVIIRPLANDSTASPSVVGVAAASAYRRAVWPSRQAAAESFRKSAFYKKWDSRVLDRWIQYGLREGPTVLYPDAKSPQVTLTTPPAHEVHTFYRPNYLGAGVSDNPPNRRTHPDVDREIAGQSPFYRSEGPNVHSRLPNLRPGAFYMFGSESDFTVGTACELKVAITGVGVGGSGGVPEGRVDSIMFQGVGHLIAMEAVEQTADVASKWISRELQLYKAEQEEYEEWTRKTLVEKQRIDEKWMEMMPRPQLKAPNSKPKESKM